MFDSQLPKEFSLLARETELAAMSLCAGLTSLRKANTSQKGYYIHAFASVSMGLERLIKLTFIIDYAINNGGSYPKNTILRSFGHDLFRSFCSLKNIAYNYEHRACWNSITDDSICQSILSVLTDFAIGARYSNLDELTSQSKFQDPLQSWHYNVGRLIFEKYKIRNNITEHEHLLDLAMSNNFLIIAEGENGKSINNFTALRIAHKESEHVNKYGTIHIVYIIKFLSTLLSTVGRFAQEHKMMNIPYFYEFFTVFNAPQKYWANKKSWSIYPPYQW